MSKRASSSRTASSWVAHKYWTPEQALAVAECLQAMREALWIAYGSQIQQAWCEQLNPTGKPPEFDPDEPF
jgi:hypothetical protein